MSATTTLRMILLGEDKSAGKALRGVGSEADKSGKKMQTFHKVGTAAGVALAGGLVLAGKAALDMTKKAADDEASASKLAQTLQKATGATKGQVAANEDWITAQGKAFGVADDDLRPAISRLAVATGSLTKAQKLASLAMDVSAGTGKSLESVSAALAKAQNGNISGLSRLGVATKDASGKTLSLTAVTKQLSDHYSGAAAKAADTTAGKQKILAVQMSELQEQIGYKLLPVMSKLVSVGLRVVDWISHNATTAGVLVGVMGTLLAVISATSFVIKNWVAITKLAEAAQWLWNAALDANPIGLVAIALGALVIALVIAYKKSSTFRAIVHAALHAVLAAAQAVAGFFKGPVVSAFNKVKDIATSAFGKVRDVTTGTFNKVKSVIAGAISWIKSHWPLILAVLTGPFGLAVLAVVKNFGRIRDAAGSAVAFIKDKFGDFVSFMAGLPGRIADMAGRFLDAGKSLGSHVISGIFDGLRSIGGFAGDLAGSIKGAVNSALHLPFTIHGPGPLPDFTIPAFAKGGIVSSPTIALIGEAGPEAVVPLSGPHAPRGIGGGGTNVTINVNVPLGADKGAAGREIVQALKAYSRVSGVRVLPA